MYLQPLSEIPGMRTFYRRNKDKYTMSINKDMRAYDGNNILIVKSISYPKSTYEVRIVDKQSEQTMYSKQYLKVKDCCTELTQLCNKYLTTNVSRVNMVV